MPSKNSGEVYVIDLGDVKQFMFVKLRENCETISMRDMAFIEDFVMTAADKYLTSQMYWTQDQQLNMDDDLMDKYWNLFREYPRDKIHFLIDDVIELISQRIASCVELPTWRIISAESRGSNMKLEVREDYRIWDWMRTRYRDFKRERS